MHHRVQRIVYPLLDPGARRKVEAFWDRLFHAFRDITFDPTLIHGDLTDRNILFDPAKQKLTRILDWSDAVFGDPAYDFAGLYEMNTSLGEKTLEGLKNTAEKNPGSHPGYHGM